jgi:isopropylmalate/homocitrate/citramalate synthase
MFALLFSTKVYCTAFTTAEAMSDITFSRTCRGAFEPAMNTAIAQEMVAYARSFVDDVEFSPMDASRTDPEFLYQILEQVIAAGAITINIPDTVGYCTPKDMAALIQGVQEGVSPRRCE